jgi:hypothetical protein
LSSQSFDVHFTMSRVAHDHLSYAQALLGHQVPSGDIAQVIERALAVFVRHLEKKKLGAGKRPRSGGSRRTAHSRHVPMHVRHAVWERDGGQCAFVSEEGHRCPATRLLEFDHVVEFARGGEATVEGIRLLCRAHNQHRAERAFGAEFMRHKRIAASEFRAAVRARAEKKAHARAAAEEPPHVQEVIPCMRALGYRPGEARDAARLCTDMADAPLEQRVRVALTHFRLRGTTVVASLPT